MSYALDTLKINVKYAAGSLREKFDKRRRALYFGWLGYQNLGDEALYYCVKEIFKDSLLFHTNGELERIYYKDKALTEFDLSVLGGGTLINRNEKVINYLLSYQEKIQRSVVFGTGVANENFWQQLEERHDRSRDWRDYLHASAFVGVRGPYSLQYMKKLGIDKAVIIGDPVLYLGQDAIVPKTRQKRVGLNFGKTSNKLWGGSDKRVEEEMHALIRILLENGWEISFYNVFVGDTPSYLEFIDKYNLKGKIRFFDASGCSMAAALAYFRDVDVFVGEKLHASIFAACSYTPFIMLEYRPKCLDFMSSIDYQKYNVRVDLFSADEVFRTVEELQANSDGVQRFLRDKVMYYKNLLVESARQIFFRGLQ